jgi:preprotein translocase subunit SecG
MQHGKGADMGASFGSGGGGQPVRRQRQRQLPVAQHGVLATVFFVCTLALAYFGNLRPASSGSVLDRAAPAASVPPPAQPSRHRRRPAGPGRPAAPIPAA